jgi:phage virion morphogenesis protein
MASLTITSRLDGPEIQAAFREWRRLGRDSTPLMHAIGVGLAENVRSRFSTGRDPDGGPWVGLSQPWASLRKPGPILVQSSGAGLLGSITSEAADGEVSVGSNKPYAGVHQFGATIRPKRGGLLIFRLSNGRAWGGARQVTVPARPYLGIGPEDEDTILENVEVFWMRFRRA